jgi:hypothetical protein
MQGTNEKMKGRNGKKYYNLLALSVTTEKIDEINFQTTTTAAGRNV